MLGPPWPSIEVRLGSQSWSALAHDFGLPWPAMGIHSEIPSRNIAAHHQFAVDAAAGTSGTKCRRSQRWDSNPRRCDCLSQPSSTQSTAPQEYSGGEADRVWPRRHLPHLDPYIHLLIHCILLWGRGERTATQPANSGRVLQAISSIMLGFNPGTGSHIPAWMPQWCRALTNWAMGNPIEW